MTAAATALASALFALGAALVLLDVALKRADEQVARWADTTHEGDGDE